MNNDTRSFASIRILGFHLDFENISKNLGVEPSRTHRAGELDRWKKPCLSDLWLLNGHAQQGESMDVHLKWLRKTLAPHYDFLHTLKKTAQIRSYCGFTADDHGSFYVSGEALNLFTEVGFDMEISTVFLGPPESSVTSDEPTEKDVDAGAAHRVPYHYGTESEVILRIIGHSLDFDGISRNLGFEPSEKHRAGDVAAGDHYHYPSDLWSLTVPLLKTDQLDDHFRWLRMALLPHSEFLKFTKRNAGIAIHCNFGTESDTGGVSLSPEGLETCTVLDIPLEFNGLLLWKTNE